MGLERKLQSVGKQAFIENYELFKSYAEGHITKETAIEQLINREVSNEAGANIRVGNAKFIFDNNRVSDALLLILQSKRMSTSVISQTRKILSSIA